MNSIVFGDVLGDFKAWLISHPLLSAVGGRVFFRIPDTTPSAPFLRLYQSGGGLVATEDTPIDNPRISVEVWGTQDGDYGSLRAVVVALKSALFQGQDALLNPSGTTFLLSGAVTTVIDAPDPETGWPRLVADLLLTVRHT